MGAYCACCRTWMHQPGDETCSAACRDRLALRRTADRQRAMAPSELAAALGDRLKPMSIDQLRSAEAAMQAEPLGGAMFSEFDRDFYFGTDVPLPLREVQGEPLPDWATYDKVARDQLTEDQQRGARAFIYTVFAALIAVLIIAALLIYRR